MGDLRKVFISHSHKDRQLAEAFKFAFRKVFKNIEVAFSSDKEAGAGPQGGRNWLTWIQDQMRDCQEALLLLTPYSIQKPWPMWEAGAVAGMAAAGAGAPGVDKAVTPLRFNLPPESLPGPFVVTQAYDGTKSDDLRKVLGDLMNRYNYVSHAEAAIEGTLNLVVPDLDLKIKKWSETATALVTEGTVVDWCQRLDRFREEKRSRDIGHLHRWLRLLYDGPASPERDAQEWGGGIRKQTDRPWDIRLHLRLGDNYVIAEDMPKAIVQYRLAGELAPLDLYVLHKLGLAQLKAKDRAGAYETIERIVTLDKEARRWNAEVAGLEGRYWKDEGEQFERDGKRENAAECYTKARAAYIAPLENGGEDHYLADNAGQMSFKIKDVAGAQQAYRKARASLENVSADNENMWTLATRAHVALVLGTEEEALAYLARIPKLSRTPTADELKSIRRGLDTVRAGLEKSDADYQRWLGALGTTP